VVVDLSLYDSILLLPLVTVIPSPDSRFLPSVDDEHVYVMSPVVDVADVSVQPSGHFSDIGGNGPALLPWSMSNPMVPSAIIRIIVAIVRTIM
jgi:hypothetical protein